jgi:hypothetical protein
MPHLVTVCLKTNMVKLYLLGLFISGFEISNKAILKYCFYLRYIHESTLISKWNHINPSFIEKVMFKLVTVHLKQFHKQAHQAGCSSVCLIRHLKSL